MVAGEVKIKGEENLSILHPLPDGDLISLRVQDIYGPGKPKILVYSETTTFGEVVADVVRHFGLGIDEIELIYQHGHYDRYDLTEMPLEERLSVVHLVPSKTKEYSLTLLRKLPRPEQGNLINNGEEEEEEVEGAGDVGAVDNIPGPARVPLPIVAPNRRDFVGLQNLSMTCYLNSTIQGLFFTPEFRNVIYLFVRTFKDNPDIPLEKKSIAEALQRIFLKLQFSGRTSIDTKDLTKTFGWKASDLSTQQDIQELLTAVIYPLIDEFKETPYDGILKELFLGSMRDEIKCMNCGKISGREEEFLSMPLTIRKPDGTKLNSPTLEEALRVFTTPEVLDGSNQYFCDACDKRVDAHKGYRFTSLPRILCVQLKRFRFDMTKMERSKIYDRVIAPLLLDMNPFMEANSSNSNDNDAKPDNDKIDTIKSPSGEGRPTHSRPDVKLDDDKENEEESPVPAQDSNGLGEIDLDSSRTQVLETLEEMRVKNGPNVYELYAVFIHLGEVAGGHYYSYIRDYETYRWYKFDDSTVRRVSVMEIKNSFGCEEKHARATAYMLVYRKHDGRNILPFLQEELPPNILELLDSVLEDDQTEIEEEEFERNVIKIDVFFREDNSNEVKRQAAAIPKELTTKNAALFCYRILFPGTPDPPLENVRVCRYDISNGVIENSWVDEDQYLSYSLRHPLPKTNNEGLLLQVKNDEESFGDYYANDIVFVTKLVDTVDLSCTRYFELHCSSTTKIHEVMRAVGVKWDIDPEIILLVIVVDNCPELLDGFEDEIGHWLRDGHWVYQLYVGLDLERVEDLLHLVIDIVEGVEIRLEIAQLQDSHPYAEKLRILDGIEGSFRVTEHDLDVTKSSDEMANLSMDEERMEVSYAGDEQSLPGTPRSPREGPMELDVMSVPNKKGNTRWAKVDIVCPKDIHKLVYIPCHITINTHNGASVMSGLIHGITGIPESDYTIFAVKHEEEEEIVDYHNPICQLDTKSFRLRFWPRLKEHEGRVEVFLLDLSNFEDFEEFLGCAVLHPFMSDHEAKASVAKMCEPLTGVNLNCLRMRRKPVSGRPSKVLRDDSTVRDWIPRIHGSAIFVQIFQDPALVEPIGTDEYLIIYRFWHQSTWELGGPVEVKLFFDHDEEVHEAVGKRLAEVLQLPIEELEIARIDDGVFPYQFNPLRIEQQLDWFSPLEQPKKPMYLFSDELVVFVRNKTEKLKEWTLEEEQKFKKENAKEEDAAYVSPPRKEVGIKISLLNSP